MAKIEQQIALLPKVYKVSLFDGQKKVETWEDREAAMPYTNISVYGQCVEFFTASGVIVRAMKEDVSEGVHKKKFGTYLAEPNFKFVRWGSVLAYAGDTPRSIWQRFVLARRGSLLMHGNSHSMFMIDNVMAGSPKGTRKE